MAKPPITRRLPVSSTSATIGTGSARLNTTWLHTSDWVTLAPSPTSTKAGAMVTARRSQSGMRNWTKSCMIVWPAMVPTMELEKPEASSDSANTSAAPPPSNGTSVW